MSTCSPLPSLTLTGRSSVADFAIDGRGSTTRDRGLDATAAAAAASLSASTQYYSWHTQQQVWRVAHVRVSLEEREQLVTFQGWSSVGSAVVSIPDSTGVYQHWSRKESE